MALHTALCDRTLGCEVSQVWSTESTLECVTLASQQIQRWADMSECTICVGCGKRLEERCNDELARLVSILV